MNKKQPNIKHIVTVLALSALATACSNSSGGSTGGGNVPFSGSNPLTIDSAGTVPVIGGNSTTSIIYVHNNTKNTISGIKYTAQLNTGDGKFLDSKSARLCASISAGQSCPLSFTTPALSKTTAQGSALITASYIYEKEEHQFNQVLSFSRIDNNTSKGALFNSGVGLVSFGNDMAYGTVYLYGSGQNKIYTVDSITSNKGGVKVTQGDITGKQLQSNYVSALEVSAPTSLVNNGSSKSGKSKSTPKAEGGFDATLTALSSEGGASYSSTSSVGVAPVSSGAILAVGNVPIIDSGVANPIGTLYITNAGNQTATLGAISFPAGVTRTGGDCGATLDAGLGCSIDFSVPQAGGNGNVTIPYTGGSAASVAATITWYNSISEALVQMVATPNPVTFSATVGTTIVVTMENIGGFDLTGVSASQNTTSGSATSNASALTCSAGGTNLPIGATCSYTETVNDTATEAGNINLGISGTYNNGTSQTYSRILAVGYTSNQYRALLSVPLTTMPDVIGNNTATQTETVTVSNNGEAPAVISNSALSSNPAYLTIVTDGCTGQTVAAGDDCQVTFQVGPTTAQSQITGSATYTATYSGGQAVLGTTAANSVDYTVQANSQNVTMQSVTPSGGVTGDGSSGSPFEISGILSYPTITLTIQNGGTNPAQISGVINPNSPIAWEIDQAASTCYNGGTLPSSTIPAGGTCTIVFKNILAENAQALALPSTYNEDLTVPTVIFQDMVATGTQFAVTPAAPAPISGTTIAVNGNQATLVNNVTQTGALVTVEHSLANATGYPALTVVSRMEDYFTGTPVENDCTTNSASGIMTQTCVLTPSGGTATASVIYTRDSNYTGATLHTLFDLTTSGYVVSFTPLSAQLILS